MDMIQKVEALKRLQMLTRQGLHKDVMRSFDKDYIVLKSERQSINIFDRSTKTTTNTTIGVLYELSEEEIVKVETFEDKYSCLVYHVIKSQWEFGTCLSYLCITKYDEEWEYEKREMTENIAFAYVENLEIKDFSEWGSIGYEILGGGLVRKY